MFSFVIGAIRVLSAMSRDGLLPLGFAVYFLYGYRHSRVGLAAREGGQAADRAGNAAH